SLTVSVRPWNWAPPRLAIACSAPSLISTKPKPRERPVSRSSTTWARVTVPNWPNAWSRSSAVVEKARLPTYRFLLIALPSGLAGPSRGKRRRRRPPAAWQDRRGPARAPDEGARQTATVRQQGLAFSGAAVRRER